MVLPNGTETGLEHSEVRESLVNKRTLERLAQGFRKLSQYIPVEAQGTKLYLAGRGMIRYCPGIVEGGIPENLACRC